NGDPGRCSWRYVRWCDLRPRSGRRPQRWWARSGSTRARGTGQPVAPPPGPVLVPPVPVPPVPVLPTVVGVPPPPPWPFFFTVVGGLLGVVVVGTPPGPPSGRVTAE